MIVPRDALYDRKIKKGDILIRKGQSVKETEWLEGKNSDPSRKGSTHQGNGASNPNIHHDLFQFKQSFL